MIGSLTCCQCEGNSFQLEPVDIMATNGNQLCLGAVKCTKCGFVMAIVREYSVDAAQLEAMQKQLDKIEGYLKTLDRKVANLEQLARR